MTTATKQHREDMDRYLSTVPKAVEKNCEVVSADEIGRIHMVHISTNTNIKAFIPMMSGRTMDKEDRSVARVCVAPELLSAMMGYGAAFYESTVPKLKKDDDPKWKNGYHIYGLPFEYALRPDKKILPDANMTNEHWLVSYNKDTAEYKPVDLGIVFYGDIAIKRGANFTVDTDVELFIRVDHKDGLWFTPHQHLAKGFWYYRGYDAGSIRNYNGTKTVKAVPIEESEFMKKKRVVAATLSDSERLFATPSILSNWR